MKREQTKKQLGTSSLPDDAPAQYKELAESALSTESADVDRYVASEEAEEIQAGVARLLHKMLDVFLAFTIRQDRRSDN